MSKCGKSLVLRSRHKNSLGNAAGLNQPYLKKNRSLPNVSGIEKSSAGLTRSLWVLKGTKRSE